MSDGIQRTASRGRIVLCGASCRAAAWSARRAGLLPEAADLFEDADLRAVCLRTRRISRYPHQLPELLNQFTSGAPWLYTGGLENYPRLVDRMARTRPLWGNSGQALRKIRDPWRVQRLLQQAELPVPEMFPPGQIPPTDTGWLRKPLASAAGQHISHWTAAAAAGAANASPDRRRFCFQRYQPGTPHSLLFLAGWPQPGQATLLGITRQLMEADLPTWTASSQGSPPASNRSGEAAFRYAGSLGPVPLAPPCLARLQQTVTILTASCGLRGLCGLDFLLDDQGTAWPVEINPRYPASAEVLELALGLPLLQLHAACFLPASETENWNLPQFPLREHSAPPAIHAGKLIVQAPVTLQTDTRLLARLRERYPHSPPAAAGDFHLPGVCLADCPAAGESIPIGNPFCTLLAAGQSLVHCHEILLSETAALLGLLREYASPAC